MDSNIIRLPAGAEYDLDLYGDYPLYSVVKGVVSGTSAKLLLFNYIQGENVPGTVGQRANELDTNLDKAAKHLGYAEEMMIHCIAWQLPHAVVDGPEVGPPDNMLLHDSIELIDKTYFAFKIQNKVYAEGTLDAFPFFGGLYVPTTQNNAEYVNNGVPQSGSAKPLGMPIHITGKSTILGELLFPYGALTLFGAEADGDGYQMRCWLLGLRARFEGTTTALGDLANQAR